MTVKQDLKTLQKEFKELGKKLEKLIAAAEKSEKPRAVKKAPAKKAPAKKSPAKKAPAKRRTRKK